LNLAGTCRGRRVAADRGTVREYLLNSSILTTDLEGCL
jgi:hypothetical protein